MLNNKNSQEKQKNDLVFKLLKSMNPYMPNISQNSAIRDQLYSIIQAQGSHIIYEQDSDDEEGSVGQEEVQKCERNIAKMIVSRVVDVKVDNGKLGNEVRQEMEGAIIKQLQAERQSKIVRRQLQNIQTNAYKHFRIPQQMKIHSHSNQSVFPSSRSNFLIEKTPTTHTFHIDSTRKSQFTSNTNSKRQFYDQTNNTLEEISQRFSGLRLELSKLQSPLKTYRYQTDRPKHISSEKHRNQKLNYDENATSSSLPLQSRIKSAPRIYKSQSQATIKEKSPSLITDYRSLTKSSKCLPSPTSSIQHSRVIVQEKAKTLLQDSRKFSAKLHKQSRKLDAQIMASILHSKIRDRDKSNTIAHLIK